VDHARLRPTHLSVEEFVTRTGACTGQVRDWVHTHGMLPEAQAFVHPRVDQDWARKLQSGSGSGYGYGDGYGSGSGYGYGYGYGDGYGDGYGSGYGYGDGYGYGYGYGDGYGDGS
jgi:hypothetical protein